MSFIVHPITEELHCPIVPLSNCQRDCWLTGDGAYGRQWSLCREVGNVRLQQSASHRCLFYQFTPPWFERDAIRYEAHSIMANIARFFWYIEGRMDWKDRTLVRRTQHPNVTAITFSGGWFQNPTSEWLATLILRLGGHCCEGRSLEWVLHQHRYGHETVPAIHRFLQGYQHYTGGIADGQGWHNLFCRRNWDQVCRLLIDRKEVENRAFDLASQDNHRQSGEHYWLTACGQFQVNDGVRRVARMGRMETVEAIPRLALHDYNYSIAA